MLTEEISYSTAIDYEELDELPLLDHAEWAHDQTGNDLIEDFGYLYWLDE